MAVVQPGDTIYVLPTITYQGLAVTVPGLPGKPITVMGAGIAPNRTKILAPGLFSAISVTANYVVVSNFDASAGPSQYAGINIAGHVHHVTLSYNVAHDSGGNGIGAYGDDYITISHNTIYGNAHNTTNWVQNSGISLLGFIDSDTNTGTKNMVLDNVVYANTNIVNCSTAACYATGRDSDGSGIILDDFSRDQFDNVAYRGRTLIANNVVYGNGGRGIYIYSSYHATLVNNTLYWNNQDPYEGNWHPGEIGMLRAADVSAYNNILYSDGKAVLHSSSTVPNTHVALSIDSSLSHMGPTIARNNMMYNPQNDPTLMMFLRNNGTNATTTGNFWVNPKLAAPSLNPLTADFRPSALSPALRAGDARNTVPLDIGGVARAGAITIGAYQTSLN